ncbi:MAG TPA: hypothetical protein VGL11_11715 [Candidatus Binatia bacterium]|jgi:hypothetical protein
MAGKPPPDIAVDSPVRRKSFQIPPTLVSYIAMEKTLSTDRLHNFFHDMTRRSFWQLGINDATVARYVADVLTDFASASNLYRIRSSAGKKLDSVVEILAETRPENADEKRVLQEREVRKYLGDYTLFMSGIFRSYVEKTGVLEYYLQEGQRSYWTVSELDLSLYRTGFILFQELSKKFEYYSGALDYMRKAYFAPEPGEDPFAGWMRQVEGWITTNLTEN